MATNVAASANGGTAAASSTLGAGYEASRANNGNRTGATYGVDGAWVENTPSSFDDWLQIDFNASYSINQIDLFGLQDNYTSPTTPTLSMTSALFGLKDFEIQYWTGSAWSTVSGGNVTGNNHVWTEFTFTPVTTSKVRVLIHAAQDPYSRVVELEAWTSPSVPGAPSSPSPANGASGVSLTPTLTWTSSGATSYDVYFGTAASPPLVNSGQASASYTPAALSGLTTYFWKIVAINSAGSTTGSIWSFTTASGSAVSSIKPTLLVEAELSGFGGGWTSLTADVERNAGVEIRHGMQGSGPGDLVAPSGTARFVLNNSARNSASLLGYYSPYHANKRTGWGLGIGCRIRFQDPNSGTYYTRMVGRIDAIDPSPGSHRDRQVAVTVTDWMDEAARWSLTPDIGEQVSKRGDEVLTAILAQMPRQPVSTSFDVGTDTYAYALDTSANSGQPALAEFVKLAVSELGPIYVKANGTFRYENRHTRLLTTSSVWTIAETALQDLQLPSTRDEILNTVRVTVHPKQVDEAPTTVVYDQLNAIPVAAGEIKFLLGPYRDPITGDTIGATDVQPQVSAVDYLGNSADDGTGTDLTSSFSIAVTAGAAGARFKVTNSSGTNGFLTTNQLMGRAIYDRGSVQLEDSDSASIDDVGEHAVTLDMVYEGNTNVGQAAATYILNKYSSAFAQARRIRVWATSSALLAHVLARDISDRLTVSETVTGLNSSYFINGEVLRLTATGHVLADYILAPAADPLAGLYFILDTSSLGTGILAPF